MRIDGVEILQDYLENKLSDQVINLAAVTACKYNLYTKQKYFILPSLT